MVKTIEEAKKSLIPMQEEYEPLFDDEDACRVCGCTWNNACEGGCYWVEEDLCSKCAESCEGIKGTNTSPCA